jgi:hypothetical protein
MTILNRHFFLLLTLVVECNPKSAEALRDALFDTFVNIDYIEIVY